MQDAPTVGNINDVKENGTMTNIEEMEQNLSKVANGKPVAISFGSYNHRRYSRPWIARVVGWYVGQKPELQFGAYVGDDNGGEVEIVAYPGDIIRYGQRDGRRPDQSSNEWGVVGDDYLVRDIKQTEARALFEQHPKIEITPSPMPFADPAAKRVPPTIVQSPMIQGYELPRRKKPTATQNPDRSWTFNS